MKDEDIFYLRYSEKNKTKYVPKGSNSTISCALMPNIPGLGNMDIILIFIRNTS